MPFSRLLRGVAIVVAYVVLASGPLVLAVSGRPQSTGPLEDLAFALGLLGFGLLGMQFLTVARSRWVAVPFGLDIVMRFHQQMSFVALAFLLAHPLLMVASRGWTVLVDPETDVVLGQVALVLLLALVGSAVLRLRLRLGYELWRITHGVGAILLMLFGAAHVLSVGRWVGSTWQQTLLVVFTALVVASYAEIRLVRPLRQLRQRWKVDDVEQVAPGTWSVALRADGHDGMHFGAGQFAWVRFDDSPFGITEHPFSFTSSTAQPGRVSFTIKELGDDTAEIGELEPGSRAFLDGPFGAFRLDRYPADRVLLVAGGVGIAPVLSILRTMADHGDGRHVVLIAANDREDDILHRDALESLSQRLDLDVVHVLSEPGADWHGEQGHVDADLLRRHLPRDCWDGLQCFVCGPPPMMTSVIDGLRSLGTPRRRIHREVFDFV